MTGILKHAVARRPVPLAGSLAACSTRLEDLRKAADNPMHRPLNMHLSPRCGAKTRSGNPCRAPAMPNGRCRMHGGASPGAPRGERNGNYRHGRFTEEAVYMRCTISALVRASQSLADLSGEQD